MGNTDHILFCPGIGVENPNGKGGRIIELDYGTKEVIFEVAVNSNNSYAFHRAERLCL